MGLGLESLIKAGVRIQIQVIGFGLWVLYFKVYGLGLKVEGGRFGVYSLGFQKLGASDYSLWI
jgi:hypothetical protein